MEKNHRSSEIEAGKKNLFFFPKRTGPGRIALKIEVTSWGQAVQKWNLVLEIAVCGRSTRLIQPRNNW